MELRGTETERDRQKETERQRQTEREKENPLDASNNQYHTKSWVHLGLVLRV